ncbi:MAG TPA: PilX N-terminal domain-containing pilus assembly protein [Dokdonella sp.]|nr:PilX N-terminal domain-containing pilus assembly protein [Dokdonella sp.]
MKRHSSIPSTAGPRSQAGAVLFVALVFLILITLLALTATGTSILQEKMTGGMRNRQLGLMGAETTLRGGEAFFTTANFSGSNPLPQCPEGGSGSVCAFPPRQLDLGSGLAGAKLDDVVQSFRTATGWIPMPPSAYSYARTLTGFSEDELKTAALNEQPMYLIEDLGADVPAGLGQQRGIIDPENQKSAWLYRLTARSQGGSGAVVRVAESVYSPGLNLGNAGANLSGTP